MEKKAAQAAVRDCLLGTLGAVLMLIGDPRRVHRARIRPADPAAVP